MRKWILPSVIAVAVLAGCATARDAEYEAMLGTWVGRSEDDLVHEWGPPSSVYQTEARKYLTYIRSESGYVPGIPPSYQSRVVGNTIYLQPIGGSPGFAYTFLCKTTFELEKGKVVSWRWEGNSCRAG